MHNHISQNKFEYLRGDGKVIIKWFEEKVTEKKLRGILCHGNFKINF